MDNCLQTSNVSANMRGGKITTSASEKFISLTSNSESFESESKSESGSDTSSDKSSEKKKSSLFNDSDCYFTESGNELNINYLSTTDQQNSKSIISEIQNLKETKK